MDSCVLNNEGIEVTLVPGYTCITNKHLKALYTDIHMLGGGGGLLYFMFGCGLVSETELRIEE